MRLPIALLALFCLPALADESVPEPAAMMPAPAAQPASVPLAPMTLPTPIDYGVLIVSRAPGGLHALRYRPVPAGQPDGASVPGTVDHPQPAPG